MSAGRPVKDALALGEIVTELELHLSEMFSSEDLVIQFRVRRRSLHDFLSICSVYGICRQDPDTKPEWLGLDQSTAAIDSIRARILAERDDSDLLKRFSHSSGQTLPHIATSVVELFFYLNVKNLDVRHVARLFGHGKRRYKTMLPKLYTVVTGLELVGIVSRTAAGPAIRLNAPLQTPAKSNQFAVSSLLHSAEEEAQLRRYEARMREFERISGKDASRLSGARLCANAASAPRPAVRRRIAEAIS